MSLLGLGECSVTKLQAVCKRFVTASIVAALSWEWATRTLGLERPTSDFAFGWRSASSAAISHSVLKGRGFNRAVSRWPTFNVMFACTNSTEGAPSLRFLQGWVAMLHALF